MVVVYHTTRSLSKSTIYVILARHKMLPEDDVLSSKHVGAFICNYM